MKIANIGGRPSIVTGDEALFVDAASVLGAEYADFEAVFAGWNTFLESAQAARWDKAPHETIDRSRLGSPSPRPRQIIAVGLNYSEHATESGFDIPDQLPPTFTKFVSSLTGPDTRVVLPEGGNADWEAELVVIIGRGGRNIPSNDAWEDVAGLAVGQDISERVTQMQGPAPQFPVGKSFAGFTPVGPWLVDVDELPDRDAIALGCSINGEIVQDGSTRDLIFPVPALIAKLSAVLELLPGDLIFTGTPAGVGVGPTPQRFLQPGGRVGVGSGPAWRCIQHRCVLRRTNWRGHRAVYGS